MNSVIVESASVGAGGRILEFKRRLNATVQEVWAALTEPEKLSQWYAEIDDYPVQGKRMQLVFQNTSTTVTTNITRLIRPAVLEYTWAAQSPSTPVSLVGSVVRFELAPHEGGTLLTVDHIFQTDTVPVADVLGGWQTHLDELTDRLHNGFKTGVALAALKVADGGTCGGRARAFAKALNLPSVIGG